MIRQSLFAQALGGGSNIHQGRSNLLFPVTTTSPWSALESAVELEELKELSWGQPLAPSPRPP